MKILTRSVVAVLSLAATGCGATPAAPNAATVNLTGLWTGTGSDAQGPETFTWTVTQTGDRITGSAIMNSANPNDGSCGGCHKQKNGTITGTLSGGALALTLAFPEGGSDITPLCGITMTASTTDIAAGRISARYTGTTTCEGPITDGSLTVVR